MDKLAEEAAALAAADALPEFDLGVGAFDEIEAWLADPEATQAFGGQTKKAQGNEDYTSELNKLIESEAPSSPDPLGGHLATGPVGHVEPGPAPDIYLDPSWHNPAVDEVLLNDPDSRRRSAAAANSNASPDALVQALKDPNSYVRAAVVGNLKTPINEVTAHTDSSRKVLAALAHRPDIPEELADQITAAFVALSTKPEANEAISFVGPSLASNKKLSAKNKVRLAKIDNVPTRVALAGRPDLDLVTSNILAKDPSPDVQAILAHSTEHAGVLKTLGSSDRNRVRAGRAGNPLLPEAEIVAATKADYWMVRAQAYANVNCPAETLIDGLNDQDSRVVISVYRSGHPALSGQAQLDLIGKSDKRRVAAAFYPGLSYEDRNELAYSGHPGQRAAIASNTATIELKLFDWLSEDKEEAVRFGVVTNRNTPPDVLSKLKNDPEPAIAAIAKGRLAL
jgi:hypothetical protein